MGEVDNLILLNLNSAKTQGVDFSHSVVRLHLSMKHHA